jgi:hypothetical protein
MNLLLGKKSPPRRRRMEGEPLLDGAPPPPPPPPSPRLFAALGAAYILLGGALLAAAALARHWPGVAVGASVLKLGTTLLAIGATGGRAAPPGAGAGAAARARSAALRALLWGSGIFQRLLYRLRWPVLAYGAFATLLLAVRLASRDPRVLAFPAACPPALAAGCARVAEASPARAGGAAPPRLAAGAPAALAAARAWVEEQPRARVLYEAPGGDFLHARFTSLLWGFADDLFVSARCDAEGRAVVEAQAQLRVGRSDLGVNRRRVAALVAALEAGAGALPPGTCGA